MTSFHNTILLLDVRRWVRSRNCGCLVTWFCYQLIAKQGNKTGAVSWPDPDINYCPIVTSLWIHRVVLITFPAGPQCSIGSLKNGQHLLSISVIPVYTIHISRKYLTIFLVCSDTKSLLYQTVSIPCRYHVRPLVVRPTTHARSLSQQARGRLPIWSGCDGAFPDREQAGLRDP